MSVNIFKDDELHRIAGNGKDGSAKIDEIKVNGETQPIEDKSVNIKVPTKVTELSDADEYATIEKVNAKISSVYKPGGSVEFENLSKPSKYNCGFVYNVIDAFITDDRFIEGAYNKYPAGTNVVVIDDGSEDYKYDVLSGFVDLTDYVTDDREIAGLDLKDDITVLELTNALGINDLEDRVSNNEENIESLQGDVDALTKNLSDTENKLEDIKNIQEQINNYIYEGRDLTQVFAGEIKNYTDPWAWIKARIKAHNFNGIHVADYIPITMNGETVNMQVAGIDTYYRTTSNQLSHHIDFISKDCLDDDTISWNNTDNNNGTSANSSPYMASKIRTYLTTTLYNYLPDEVKRVISNKRTLMETRYSSSGTLEDSTGWSWVDLGPLWLPTEYEVFGSIIWGTKSWSAGQAIQYPIFANSYLNRIKRQGDSGSRCWWWLASVCGGSSEHCVNVYDYGGASSGDAGSEYCVPVCFRIDEA